MANNANKGLYYNFILEPLGRYSAGLLAVQAKCMLLFEYETL